MKKPAPLDEKRPAVPSSTKPLDPEIDLPVGKGVLVMKVPKMGWTVLEVKTQGHKVIEATVVESGVDRAVAQEAVKLRTVRYTFVEDLA